MFVIDEGGAPWSEAVTRTLVSLVDALGDPTRWGRWRDSNRGLVEFATAILGHSSHHDRKTVIGATVLEWFVRLGDCCDQTHQSRAAYLNSCHRLKDLPELESSPLGKYVATKAWIDPAARRWNSIDHTDRRKAKVRREFGPFLDTMIARTEAGDDYLVVSWSKNCLAIASQWCREDLFPLFREHLERAWERHYGYGTRPDYNDKSLFDSDFDRFRSWIAQQDGDVSSAPPAHSASRRRRRRAGVALAFFLGSVVGIDMDPLAGTTSPTWIR